MKSDANSEPGILARTTPEDQGLVTLPTLTPHLQYHEVGEQQTLLVSESFNTLLRGQPYCDLMPFLDGNHTLDSIVAALGPKYGLANFLSTFVSLSTKGYVVSANHGLDSSQAAYWSSLGASPRWAEKRFAETRVVVKGDQGKLVRRLEESGVFIDSKNPDLVVIACDDFLSPGFAELNLRHLEMKTPWMLVRPRGIEPLFGPIFRSDNSGPCWKCLTYRLRNHQEVHNFLRHVRGEDVAFKAFATDRTLLETIYGLVSNEIAKWLVLSEDSPIHNHAISYNAGTSAISRHFVMRRPQCEACGDVDLCRPDRPPVPLELNASPKNNRNSGGVHNVAPAVTLAKYRHLVSPISGVVSWLSRTSEETDPWLHVYWAGSNFGMRSRSLSSLRKSLRSKSAGKGSTREQSEASALCEAIERQSGTFQGTEIRSLKRFSDFATDEEAIHPNAVQLFSDHQLANARELNSQGHPYNVIPPRVEEHVKLHWTPVWSLTQQRHRYLPTTMLYSTPAELRSPNDLIADSNGCAAGNTLEEAILQGFYELVERDAFAIWWYNQLQVPALDVESFNDDYLSSAANYYARLEREIWMLDITSDLGVPSFVALSRRLDAETEDIIYGAGAHSDPRIAALRAMCELNQCLSWLPRSTSSDGRPMIDDPLALWWWKTARLNNCPWLLSASTTPVRKASDFGVAESEDMRGDVEICRAKVEGLGLEFLVLDQTRPDIGMPVVRVIVPGLRHFWARFAPGRLYDVPVRLGLRETRLDETELNATPLIA